MCGLTRAGEATTSPHRVTTAATRTAIQLPGGEGTAAAAVATSNQTSSAATIAVADTAAMAAMVPGGAGGGGEGDSEASSLLPESGRLFFLDISNMQPCISRLVVLYYSV